MAICGSKAHIFSASSLERKGLYFLIPYLKYPRERLLTLSGHMPTSENMCSEVNCTVMCLSTCSIISLKKELGISKQNEGKVLIKWKKWYILFYHIKFYLYFSMLKKCYTIISYGWLGDVAWHPFLRFWISSQ